MVVQGPSGPSLVIEVDGPSHFAINDPRRRVGKSRMKQRVIERHGEGQGLLSVTGRKGAEHVPVRQVIGGWRSPSGIGSSLGGRRIWVPERSSGPGSRG